MVVIDKRMETVVEHILEEVPETRGSDDALLYEYIVRIGDGECLNATYGWMLKHGSDAGYPKRSSVSRARRKIQERRPELKDAKVAARRAEREQDFRDYARNS